MIQSKASHGTARKATIFSRFRSFMISVWAELKKVVWPTRRELTASTTVVIISIVIVGIFVAVLDTLFASLFLQLGRITGIGG